MQKPLADRMRPISIEEVVGQQHLLGQGKVLQRILASGHITNMIFYGPPGTGKTTVANIAAKMANKTFYKLNATHASTGDIKSIVNDLDTLMTMNGVLLYLDEIQNFNKKQQQSLLEYIENGKITLIASTTENPYHYIYNAILSRSTVFEFKPIGDEEIIKAMKRAVKVIQEDFFSPIEFEEAALEHIARMSSGDVRKALNAVELAIYATKPSEDKTIYVTVKIAEECSQKKSFQYDKFGDHHYDILSAFQKSIRGSDPDAAIHYLARLVQAGDLISICRRLLVIAAEDVGLAYPSAISIVKSCVDAANQLGFPEARIPLAQAVLVLATAPKSNSALIAIDAALRDIETENIGEIPMHLKDAHYGGAKALGRGIEYKYPHNYKNHYVKQQYLPDPLKGKVYYQGGENKLEEKVEEYLRYIKKDV